MYEATWNLHTIALYCIVQDKEATVQCRGLQFQEEEQGTRLIFNWVNRRNIFKINLIENRVLSLKIKTLTAFYPSPRMIIINHLESLTCT